MSDLNPNSFDNWKWHKEHAEPTLRELLARERNDDEYDRSDYDEDDE